MAKSARPKLACCIELCGHPTVGIVMYRLAFWSGKAAIVRDGRQWFAKSYDDIAWETGLSYQQVRDGVTKLRKLGFVVTGQYHFQGTKTLHIAVANSFKIRLHQATLSGSGDTDTTVSGDTDTTVSGDTDTTVSGDTVVIDYTSYNHMEDYQGGLSCSSAPPCANGSEAQQGSAEVPSVKDIIAGGIKKPNSKPAKQSLHQLWVKVLAEESGQYVAPLTLKSIGQLKQFVAKCPEGRAPAIMEYALRNWTEFCKQVEHDKGYKNTPAIPQPAFLLTHAQTAVNLLSEATTPAPAQAKQEAPLPKPVTLMSKPEAVPMTKAEMLKILGGGDT